MARSSYLFLLLLSLLIAGFAAPAVADKRVALVIGNSAYQNAPALVNPKNDAQDIDKSLRDLGFFTIVATDLDRAGMNDVLDRFSRMIGGADIALVYYSGHGMQFAGKNFLLPVEARLESAEDVNRFRLMPLDDVFDVLQGAPGARIVLLDACRNNPVEDDLKRRLASIPGANRDAFLTRGFSRVMTNGLIVAYATQANDVASDGTGGNSPFAAALLHNLGTPDLDLRQMLFNVQDEVDRVTGGKQRPELSISLVGQYKLKAATGPAANQEVVAAPPVDAASQAWAVTRDTTSQAVLEDFIRQFGNTVYASMAHARLEELKKTRVTVAPAIAAPEVPSPSPLRGSFDGEWLVTGKAEFGCAVKSWTGLFKINGSEVLNYHGKAGHITGDGRFQYKTPAAVNPNVMVLHTGKLQNNAGVGSYSAPGCRGSEALKKVEESAEGGSTPPTPAADTSVRGSAAVTTHAPTRRR